ncbi:rhamnulokinase [Gracilibacillus oryzae]|uniref:Rhamnulokinase n=1 Tax=Gracilibacillus oryzae TaxID=1672701 RepID=A0A7C8KY85_9BACI|nr:rhamnulokinase family protein [Gracilibacillus oryzae]KAB8130498.1 rhamnulokinase [Gracilibacillus oryzae]
MKKVWAFDIGASNGRLMLASFDGEQMHLDELYRFSNKPVHLTDHYYWDVLHIFNGMKKGMEVSLQKGHNKVESMGVDTWGVDFGLLSKTGELLANPYCYRDPQNNDGMEKALKHISKEELFVTTGIETAPINSLFQLLAIQERNPELLANADTLLLTPNLLGYLFSGVKNNEYTISSTTQLIDLKTKNWSNEILSMFNIPADLFAPVVPSSSIAGETLPEINKELGMSPVKVVNVAGHDTASALAALPIGDGFSVFMSCGTWGLIGVEVDQPVATVQAMHAGFTNEGTLEGNYRLLKNSMGMWLLQECRTIWEREQISTDYEEENQLFQQTEAFGAFIDPDDNRFFNPDNMVEAIKVYCRETNQQIPQTRGEIIRCILESLAMNYRLVIEQLEQLLDRKLKRIHMGGGAIQNHHFCQLIANVTGRELVAGPAEASSVGNAISQFISLDIIDSLREARQIVKNSFSIPSYYPEENDRWDEAYQQYKTIISYKLEEEK